MKIVGWKLMDFNVIFKVKEEVEFNTFDSETIILLPNTGDFFSLNETGTYIFSLVNGSNSVYDICEEVASNFKIEKDQATSDVEEFLLGLIKHSVVVQV